MDAMTTIGPIHLCKPGQTRPVSAWELLPFSAISFFSNIYKPESITIAVN